MVVKSKLSILSTVISPKYHPKYGCKSDSALHSKTPELPNTNVRFWGAFVNIGRWCNRSRIKTGKTRKKFDTRLVSHNIMILLHTIHITAIIQKWLFRPQKMNARYYKYMIKLRKPIRTPPCIHRGVYYVAHSTDFQRRLAFGTCMIVPVSKFPSSTFPQLALR